MFVITKISKPTSLVAYKSGITLTSFTFHIRGIDHDVPHARDRESKLKFMYKTISMTDRN